MKKYYNSIQWFSGIFIFLIIVNWQGSTAICLNKYSKRQDSVIHAWNKKTDSINNPNTIKNGSNKNSHYSKR